MRLFEKHQWFRENRLIFQGGETPENVENVIDFSQEDMEVIDFDEAMSQADNAVYETIDAGEENIQKTKEEERSWGDAIKEFVGWETFESFDNAQEAFENHDTAIAAKTFADVMQLSNGGENAKDSITKVEAKYGPVTTAGPGKDLAYAVLIKMGMDRGNFEDFTRARKGERTLQNMDLGLSGDQVDEIKLALLPNSYTDQFVKAMTGQRKLEGYQRVLLAPANAIEGVATGFLKLPSTIKTLVQMGSELAKNPELQSVGIKADLILKVIDQYFSPAEKVAIIAQFVGEGIVGAGIGGIVSKISKFPRIATLLSKTSELKFAKIATITTRTAGKVGGSRAIGRTTDTYNSQV